MNDFGCNRDGARKSGLQRTKAPISLKCGEVGPTLLLRTNRKSHKRFRLVLKSTIFDDLEGLSCTRSQKMQHGVVTYLYSFIFNLLLGTE